MLHLSGSLPPRASKQHYFYNLGLSFHDPATAAFCMPVKPAPQGQCGFCCISVLPGAPELLKPPREEGRKLGGRRGVRGIRKEAKVALAKEAESLVIKLEEKVQPHV